MATTPTGRALLAAPHVVDFSRTGYGLQHPIGCRPDLIRCPMNKWLAAQGGPSMKPGRYLMAAAGQFERVPKDWVDLLTPDSVEAIEREAIAASNTTLRAALMKIRDSARDRNGQCVWCGNASLATFHHAYCPVEIARAALVLEEADHE